MDVGGRADRDSDLGDDSPMSHGDETSDREDDMRDCESSDEGVNVNSHINGNNTGMDYPRSPPHINPETHLSHPQYGPNHPLGMLGNFIGVSNLQNLQNIPNLQHNDVLEKLKMQVREMKVGFMQEQDFPLHSFNPLHSQPPPGVPFTLPPVSTNNGTGGQQPQNLSQPSQQNGFSFTPPNAPHAKDGNPGSNSSTSSETSNSSQQNNGWSFEEQFKQVRQLYEINDDPRRKEFLDDLFSYMQKRGTPINRLPIMAKSVLDLYELYNLVIARGGLVDVINKKLWQEIIKGLHLPSSITSAAFTLRTQYMKYLYPYECEKKNLSTPAELQAAIDGNRREGRRSSYGQFDSQMQGQLQMRSPGGMQQMSPLSLVTHGTANSNPNHRLMGVPSLGHMANQLPNEYSERVLEYLKIIHNNSKELRRSQSPDIMSREQLEMQRLALWSISMANNSPPVSVNNTSPPNHEPQREALNLAESPPHVPMAIKRERDLPADYNDRDRDLEQPPTKRLMPTPTNIESLHGMHQHLQPDKGNATAAAAAAAAAYHKMHIGRSHHDDHDDHSDTSLIEHNVSSEERSHRRLSTPPPHQNGGTTAATNTGSPNTILSGMQFKITSRGNSATGEQQLIVTMELNGVQYDGVLFANPASLTAASATASATSGGDCKSAEAEASPGKVSTNHNNNNNNNNTIDERSNRVVRPPLVSS